MNTRFEILLHGESEAALRAAGEEALDEIDRLEDQLSIFRPASEIARVNRHAAEAPVRVSRPVFELLQAAQRLSLATDGAFDPSVAPLVRAWGFLGGTGARPEPDQLREARQCVGMREVVLDDSACTVRFRRDGMMLDLGAIGKGFAIDRAVEILREAGVTSAFLHGGTSSAYGLGLMPDGRPWKAAIPTPSVPGEKATRQTAPLAEPDTPLAEIALSDLSLGVSAVSGKAFVEGDRRYGHVIDPRSGEPVRRAELAAVSLPSAAESDALSTALLVLGEDGIRVLSRLRPEARALVLVTGAEGEAARLIRHNLPA